jgi:hypothetical protein
MKQIDCIAAKTNGESAGKCGQENRGRSMHIVLVGTLEYGSALYDALCKKRFRLSILTDHHELWRKEDLGCVHLVILHNAIALPELNEAARFIRRRWSNAFILVMRQGENFLDDPLYDERLHPDTSATDLALRVEMRLTSR